MITITIASYIFVIFVLLVLFFYILVCFSEFIFNIKCIFALKRTKGVYVIATYKSDNDGNKTRKMSFVMDIRKNGYSHSENIRKALKFKSQYLALEAVRECSFGDIFVIRLGE